MPSHDPEVCGLSLSTDCDACRVKNEKYLNRQEKLHRLEMLLEHLKDCGINLADLTELVWMELEPTIEARIERLAREAVRINLEGLQLMSEVRSVRRREKG